MYKFAVLLQPAWERFEELKQCPVVQLNCLETMLFKENRYYLYTQGGGSETKQLQPLPPFRSQTVLILAIPSKIAPEKFFASQLEQYQSDIIQC